MENRKKAYIGIDPGMSKTSPGAAVILIEKEQYKIHDWQGAKIAAQVISKWQAEYFIEGVAIEKVNSFRNDGHMNAFTFGENFGIWQGILYGLGIRFDLVPPKTWQRVVPPHFRGDPKTRSMKTAKMLFPGIDEFIKFKYHNGRADAILIAHYAREQGRLKGLNNGL